MSRTIDATLSWSRRPSSIERTSGNAESARSAGLGLSARQVPRIRSGSRAMRGAASSASRSSERSSAHWRSSRRSRSGHLAANAENRLGEGAEQPLVRRLGRELGRIGELRLPGERGDARRERGEQLAPLAVTEQGGGDRVALGEAAIDHRLEKGAEGVEGGVVRADRTEGGRAHRRRVLGGGRGGRDRDAGAGDHREAPRRSLAGGGERQVRLADAALRRGRAPRSPGRPRRARGAR